MPLLSMHLKILLPFGVFIEKPHIVRIVAQTHQGSFGLLPRRLDCVVTLEPGILIYEAQGEGEAYVAVDEGILIKFGPQVLVSVRNAIGGKELGQLHDLVEQEFLRLGEQEQNVRSVAAKLETGLLRRLAAFQHE